jgi:MFS family permease
MNAAARSIQRIYLTLTLGNTLAASFIWGVNTLFLLDAGLSNFEAFAANAFFTVGMVIFEIPTGVVADGWGRRISFLLGTVTLAGLHLPLLPPVAVLRPVPAVGRGVGPARPGLHLLLRSRRGMAC